VPNDPFTDLPAAAAYPAVGAMLRALHSDVRRVLGDRLLGFYVTGSLAMGAFDEAGDIDFLAVTTEALPDETVQALTEMHHRLGVLDPRWGVELEGAYIPARALRRHDPAHGVFPHIERGERLRVQEHGQEWDVMRHVAREYGIVVEGPSLRSLIGPVSPEALRRTVYTLLDVWWPGFLADPSKLKSRGYRSYVVLTGCRMLYTLQHGDVATKPDATRWAKRELPDRWTPLIDWATAARLDARSGDMEYLDETSVFIRYVLERGRQARAKPDAARDK